MAERSSYMYRHVWPILDEDRPVSALKVEATAALDPILSGIKAKPTGQPSWTVAGDRLVCEILVELAPEATGHATPSDGVDHDAVLRLVQVGWSDKHIAEELGCAASTASRIRHAAGYPPSRQIRARQQAVA